MSFVREDIVIEKAYITAGTITAAKISSGTITAGIIFGDEVEDTQYPTTSEEEVILKLKGYLKRDDRWILRKNNVAI